LYEQRRIRRGVPCGDRWRGVGQRDARWVWSARAVRSAAHPAL